MLWLSWNYHGLWTYKDELSSKIMLQLGVFFCVLYIQIFFRVFPNSIFKLPSMTCLLFTRFPAEKKVQVPNFVGDSYHYLRGLSSLLFTIPLIFHAPFIRYFLPSIRWMTILTYARWINVLFTCHKGCSRVIPLSSGSSSAGGWLLLLTLCRSLQTVCKPWGPWCTSLG